MSTRPIAPLPVARPSLGKEEAEAVQRVLESGWVTQGPEVAAFESEFAAFVGAPHACAVSSCTAGLHLALRAVGVQSGDEVVTVSHSFIATAAAVRYCGATPVFVDVDAGTGNLDPGLIAGALSGRTRAILAVHQLGMPCDLAAIASVGRERGIPIIEDAACAVGSEIELDGGWERIGRPHADVACFSFHPRKLLTTGDGGMLTTRNSELDRRFRLWRQHGMSVSDRARHLSSEVVFESYDDIGYNYRLTDVQAAIGREQLKRLPHAIERRRALAATYRVLLGTISGVTLPAEPVWARSNWQSYSVLLPEGADQRAVMSALHRQGISTRRGVMCAHREPAFAAGTFRCGSMLDISELRQDRTIMLPMFETLTPADQRAVADALRAALQV